MAKVNCAFYDVRNKVVVPADIDISTGLGPEMLRVRDACHQYASERGLPMLAHPDRRPGSDMWLAYCVDGRMLRFVRAFPGRDAAEMWMIHHG